MRICGKTVKKKEVSDTNKTQDKLSSVWAVGRQRSGKGRNTQPGW